MHTLAASIGLMLVVVLAGVVAAARTRRQRRRLAVALAGVEVSAQRLAEERSALRAAAGDAALTLARRQQAILARQLDSIDRLYRSPQAAPLREDLATVQRLAARMVRSCESQLVLAGVEPKRQAAEAMWLADVVWTAAGQIEHSARVSLELAGELAVQAEQVRPLAHLLAELLQNATTCSEPDSPVIVAAAAAEGAGHVRISVSDDGLGLPASQLAQVNARIAAGGSDEWEPHHRGFFVIGRLAERLGADVTLSCAPGRGTVALIDLPSSLFCTEAPPAIEGRQAAEAVELPETSWEQGLSPEESLDGVEFLLPGEGAQFSSAALEDYPMPGGQWAFDAEDLDAGQPAGQLAGYDVAEDEAAGYEAAGYEAAGYEAAGYEAAGDEAAGDEAAGDEEGAAAAPDEVAAHESALPQPLPGAVEILPQRTSIRTALLRSTRRRGGPEANPMPADPAPLDLPPHDAAPHDAAPHDAAPRPVPPNPRAEAAPDAPAEPIEAEGHGGLPDPLLPWGSAGVPLDRRQKQRAPIDPFTTRRI